MISEDMRRNVHHVGMESQRVDAWSWCPAFGTTGLAGCASAFPCLGNSKQTANDAKNNLKIPRRRGDWFRIAKGLTRSANGPLCVRRRTYWTGQPWLGVLTAPRWALAWLLPMLCCSREQNQLELKFYYSRKKNTLSYFLDFQTPKKIFKFWFCLCFAS